MATHARRPVRIAILAPQSGATAKLAPVSDVPAAPVRMYDEPPSELTPAEIDAALARAKAGAGAARVHMPGVVETRWPTVEDAREYRKWLEAEATQRANDGLTRAERKVLRMLQRDPRSRDHPTKSIEFKRIADARVKRKRRAEQLAQRSAAGKKARARSLVKPPATSEATKILDDPWYVQAQQDLTLKEDA